MTAVELGRASLRDAWEKKTYALFFAIEVLNPSRGLTLFRWVDHMGKQNGPIVRTVGDQAAVEMATALLDELAKLRRSVKNKPMERARSVAQKRAS